MPGVDLPERVRDLPLTGTVVRLSETQTDVPAGWHHLWTIRFDDLDHEIDLPEEVLMSMDDHP